MAIAVVVIAYSIYFILVIIYILLEVTFYHKQKNIKEGKNSNNIDSSGMQFWLEGP